MERHGKVGMVESRKGEGRVLVYFRRWIPCRIYKSGSKFLFSLWVFLSEEKTIKQEPLGFSAKPSKWKTKIQKNRLEKNPKINGERTKHMKNQNAEG